MQGKCSGVKAVVVVEERGEGCKVQYIYMHRHVMAVYRSGRSIALQDVSDLPRCWLTVRLASPVYKCSDNREHVAPR